MVTREVHGLWLLVSGKYIYINVENRVIALLIDVTRNKSAVNVTKKSFWIKGNSNQDHRA